MTRSDGCAVSDITQSDDEVMALVAAGDADAFGQLYDRFSRRAFRLARTMGGNPQQAEDAVQEAFLSIWRSRQTYRPERGGAAAWLLTIVRHRAIDVGRAHRSVDARRADASCLDALCGTADMAEQAVACDENARLRSSLHRLSDPQREVITLAYFGQLTHTEIAAHLGVPEGTVKSRIRLGLEHLRSG